MARPSGQPAPGLMHNFVLHTPTKILFGRGTVNQIGTEARLFGHRILLLYGMGSCKANGLHATVVNALEQAGCTVFQQGNIRPNPVVDDARTAIALARRHSVDAIVALGGGSVMDTAKAVAAGSLVRHDVWQFFRGKKSIKAALPVLCVATLAASGSETNGGMVLTNQETREKFGIGCNRLRPRVAILDPTATFSVPPDHTAYGAVDALSHILEFYCTATAPHTPVQDRIMEGLAISIRTSCEQTLTDPTDYDSRADLMWCAALALHGITGAGLGRVGFPMHLIEHSLSALYDVPHGAGLAVVIPAWLRYAAQHQPARIASFMGQVFQLDEPQATTACALEGIAALRQWFERIGCPTTLQQLAIAPDAIPVIAANTKGLARLWRLQEYTPEVIGKILTSCLE